MYINLFKPIFNFTTKDFNHNTWEQQKLYLVWNYTRFIEFGLLISNSAFVFLSLQNFTALPDLAFFGAILRISIFFKIKEFFKTFFYLSVNWKKVIEIGQPVREILYYKVKKWPNFFDIFKEKFIFIVKGISSIKNLIIVTFYPGAQYGVVFFDR